MRRELVLPKLKIELSFPQRLCLMVLGGREPSPEWLSSLSFQDEVWAVDRGLDSCFRADITPGRLIGDGDSAAPQLWKMAEDLAIPISKFHKDKDFTDFQLALDIYSEINVDRDGAVFITGCFGGRFDHLWSTIVTFISGEGAYIPLCAADEREGMLFVRGNSDVSLVFSEIPEAISIIPFSTKCSGVTIGGVRWPLSNADLKYSSPYSISNRLENSHSIDFSIEEGLAGLYWKL